jgi:hypothetical protein
MADQITQWRVGVPGAPGAGITAAEKAALMPKAGGVFTGAAKLTPSSDGDLVLYEKADGTDLISLDTTNGILKFLNGLDIRMYSDGGTTQKAHIDGGTGAIDIESSIDVNSAVKGESVWLGGFFDNGASVLPVGMYFMVTVPWDGTIASDANAVGGPAAWRVWVDTGTIGLDIWCGTYAQLPLSNAQRISGTLGSNNPRVTSGGKNQSSSLTNWSTGLVGGNFLLARIDSVASATKCTWGIHAVKA